VSCLHARSWHSPLFLTTYLRIVCSLWTPVCDFCMSIVRKCVPTCRPCAGSLHDHIGCSSYGHLREDPVVSHPRVAPLQRGPLCVALCPRCVYLCWTPTCDCFRAMTAVFSSVSRSRPMEKSRTLACFHALLHKAGGVPEDKLRLYGLSSLFCVTLCLWLRGNGVIHRGHKSIDRPFIVLTETKISKHHIPVWARYSPLRTRVEAHANTLSP
jgi:hypothetical protein